MRKMNQNDITSDLEKLRQEKQKTEANHSVEGLLDLAKKALREDNFSIGLYYLDRAIELDPENPSLIKERIKVFIVLEDYKEVKDMLEYILTITKDQHEDAYDDAQTALKICDIKIDQQKRLDAFPIYG